MYLRLIVERWSCALALAFLAPALAFHAARGQGTQPTIPANHAYLPQRQLFAPPEQGANSRPQRTAAGYPYLLSSLNGLRGAPRESQAAPPGWDEESLPSSDPQAFETQPVEETWIAPSPDGATYLDADAYAASPGFSQESLVDPYPQYDAWCWQMLPDGIIYRSYWAGVHEPRTGVVLFSERDGRSLWDATLGGRFGLLRYGDTGTLRPQGWQLDVEGAALARLTLDDMRDMDTVDYRAGLPLTYGIGNWQFKLAYYHLSSHLADEFAINHPGSLDDRINYVRDAIVIGASYYPNPAWRLYSEAGYAFNADGGAEPWEFQFGTEYARPGVTGFHGTPFVALNGHLREENNFSGDVNAQVGWLWRGKSGQTMRIGAQYYNGKSSQYQTFDDSEEQIGLGLWYDF